MLAHRGSSTISATSLDLRLPDPRDVVWCGRGSRTYIVVTMINVVGGFAAARPILDLLAACMNIVAYEIEKNHDGPINGGIFDRTNTASGLSFQVLNTNNHQVTYGVLGSALSALTDYMNRNGCGSCAFSIHDGTMQVGMGQIAMGRI